jgi:hypothetical protein
MMKPAAWRVLEHWSWLPFTRAVPQMSQMNDMAGRIMGCMPWRGRVVGV